MQGTVSRYFDEKGFGFIRGDDEKSYFVHCTNIIGQHGHRTLNVGDQVEFDSRDGDRGPVAYNVAVMVAAQR